MTLKHLTEFRKNQSESPMPICFETFVTYWTGKGSDQTEIESWKRTNSLKRSSPLLPLRGARIAAKVIEDVHVVAAREPKVTRFAISLGTGNVKREKIVPISMSRTPNQDLVPLRRRGRARAVARVSPLQRCQGKRWPKPHAHTSNRANVVVVTSASINTKMQLLPQRIQNEQIGLHQRSPKKKASAKAAPCITQSATPAAQRAAATTATTGRKRATRAFPVP